MARPTVRIQPPSAGDEDWLASMLAPLLDDDPDALARAFRAGPVDVGEGLDPAESAELVEVLRGFGADAERLDDAPILIAGGAQRPLVMHTTQPFDGAQLRQMIDAHTASAGQVVSAGQGTSTGQITPAVGMVVPTRSARPIPPPLRPSDSIPPLRTEARGSGELMPPQRAARPSPAPPQAPTELAPQPVAPAQRPLAPSSPPAVAPIRMRTDGPGVAQPIDEPPPPPGAPPHHVNGAEAITTQNNAQAVRADLPPWFPQMSIRPASEEAPPAERRSWLWILLVVLIGGAAAWWLRSGG